MVRKPTRETMLRTYSYAYGNLSIFLGNVPVTVIGKYDQEIDVAK